MLHLPLPLFFSLILPALTFAQLTPSPAYSPPSATAGTTPSTASPNTQWSNILGNSLWFYDAQRSGTLDAGAYGNRVNWRNDSALNDGSDRGIDLTGGWYDAGDARFPYVFGIAQLTRGHSISKLPSLLYGFTLFGLSWGALTHGHGYDLASQTPYLDGTLRWGFDWLMKAHPEDDVLYVQVGSSDVDNAYWGGDQNIPGPRPAYPVNSSAPGTDVLASTSSAFAMASLLYTPSISYNTTSTSSPPTSPSLSNATYASMLLSHATSLYKAANSHQPYTLFSISIPAVASAYSSSTFGDDLCLAALALALASNQSRYYADAYAFYQSFSLSGTHSVWNWDSKTPAIYVLFVEAATARPGLAEGAGLSVNLTGWQKETENYFDGLVAGNFKNAYLTKGGLLFWNGDSNQASLNPAMAAAMLMIKYAPMASSSAKAESYNVSTHRVRQDGAHHAASQSFAQSQLDYLMGNNPMNAVYLVGAHPNSPQNPHSAPASGGTEILHIRTSPQSEAHVLYGALVGGPLSDDKFWDWRDDYIETEVALDYNAMIPTLAAMQLLNGTSDPFYVTLQAGTYSIPKGQPCDDALPCGRGGLSKGAIAGIVIGVVLGVALIVGALVWWKRERIATWWRRGYRQPRK